MPSIPPLGGGLLACLLPACLRSGFSTARPVHLGNRGSLGGALPSPPSSLPPSPGGLEMPVFLPSFQLPFLHSAFNESCKLGRSLSGSCWTGASLPSPPSTRRPRVPAPSLGLAFVRNDAFPLLPHAPFGTNGSRQAQCFEQETSCKEWALSLAGCRRAGPPPRIGMRPVCGCEGVPPSGPPLPFFPLVALQVGDWGLGTQAAAPFLSPRFFSPLHL